MSPICFTWAYVKVMMSIFLEYSSLISRNIDIPRIFATIFKEYSSNIPIFLEYSWNIPGIF
jgi:hypothetical protein